MTSAEKPTIMYINGLGNGERTIRQELALANLNVQGYELWRTRIDWLSKTTFAEHLAGLENLAESLLSIKGRLAIVGSSAGASMAFNVFGKLAPHHKDLWAVSLCGRLKEGKLRERDWRTLGWAAHMGHKRESQSFLDSVKFCESKTLPGLTPELKQRLFIEHQLFDFVVPHSTQIEDGIPNQRIPLVGHGLGVLAAGFMLPSTIRHQTAVAA